MEMMIWNILAGVGFLFVVFLLIVILWGIFLTRSMNKKKNDDRDRIMDMLDPDKRKEKVDDLLKEARREIDDLTKVRKELMADTKIEEKAEEVIDEARSPTIEELDEGLKQRKEAKKDGDEKK